jgi:hypothetical protein
MDNIGKDAFDQLKGIGCVLNQKIDIQGWTAAEIGQAVNQMTAFQNKPVLVV